MALEKVWTLKMQAEKTAFLRTIPPIFFSHGQNPIKLAYRDNDVINRTTTLLQMPTICGMQSRWKVYESEGGK